MDIGGELVFFVLYLFELMSLLQHVPSTVMPPAERFRKHWEEELLPFGL